MLSLHLSLLKYWTLHCIPSPSLFSQSKLRQIAIHENLTSQIATSFQSAGMNWTGGRLQQSKRGKRGDLTTEQKAYFSRAKARRTKRLIDEQNGDQDLQHASDIANGPSDPTAALTFRDGSSSALFDPRFISNQSGPRRDSSLRSGEATSIPRKRRRSLAAESRPPSKLEEARIGLLREPQWLDLGDRTGLRRRTVGSDAGAGLARRRQSHKETTSNTRDLVARGIEPCESSSDDTSGHGNGSEATNRNGHPHADKQRLKIFDTADLDLEASTSSSSSSSSSERSAHAIISARQPVKDTAKLSQHYSAEEHNALDNAGSQQYHRKTRQHIARTDSKISHRAQQHHSNKPSPNRAIDLLRQQTPQRRTGKHGWFADHRRKQRAERLP